MKPNFALTLSFEGISLLHRAFPGWHMVGEVSLGSADLGDALSDLRGHAERLDNHPIRSKLVIPNDQIRYLHIDAEGLDADEIADAVHRALKGATPYPVDDLAYDWSIGAGHVYVAVVARETLAEAESFASDHGFNPLCFVAVPEGRDFVGEPWFGETKAAATLLQGNDPVERDTAAIRVIGTAPTSAPSAAQDAVVEPAETSETPAEPDLKPKPEPVTQTTPEQDGAPAPIEDATQAPVPDTKPEPVPDPGPDPTPNSTPVPEAPLANIVTDDNGGTDPEPAPQESEKPTQVAFSSIRARRDDMPNTARRLSGATRGSATPDPASSAKKETRNDPPLTAAPPPRPKAADQVTGTPQDALPESAAARIGATLRPTEVDRMTTPGNAEESPDDIPPPPPFMTDKFAPAEDDIPPAERAKVRAEADQPPAFSTRRQEGNRRLGLRSSAPPTPTMPEADHEQEKQRMTIFGARKSAPVGGKPRFLGLILTAVLLIFLVGVAAWASIFLEDGLARILRDGPDTPTKAIAATPDAEIKDEGAEASSPGTEDTVIAALPGVTSDVEDEPRTAQPQPAPAELTDQQTRTRYAVTGIWQSAPGAPDEPITETLDDFYLTSIDPKVLEQDAIALPDPGTLLGDARPDTPADPPAANTMFSIDTRGFVQASPEGALTPDGVVVYAGKPDRLPPPRPEETLAEPAEDPATTALNTAEAQRLAGIRPRTRPGDLAETNERETLGGRTRNELASLRPKLRPQSAQELAEEQTAAATPETTAEATPDTDTDISPDPGAVEAALRTAAAVQPPDPFAGATAQAVKVSVKPNSRPRNFETIVQRTQRQAEQRATQAAAVAVPRAQQVAPSGPTPTTVARAATEKNALKLRRVNLIGVYGTSSNRRALVRLANGRYQKVKVGDRLDGGRVAAIGTSELRYVKSGRSVTLTMPRG